MLQWHTCVYIHDVTQTYKALKNIDRHVLTHLLAFATHSIVPSTARFLFALARRLNSAGNPTKNRYGLRHVIFVTTKNRGVMVLQAWQHAVGSCGAAANATTHPLAAQRVNAVSVYGVVASTHVTPNGGCAMSCTHCCKLTGPNATHTIVHTYMHTYTRLRTTCFLQS